MEYARNLPLVVYSTADCSPQSGAVRSLIRLVQGEWCLERFATLGYLNQGLERSPLLRQVSADSVCFGHLPVISRSLGWGKRAQFPLQVALSSSDLASLLRRRNAVILHVNEILDLYAGFAAKLAGRKCVWHVRGDITSPAWLRKSLSRLSYHLADKVICVSNSVRRNMFPDIAWSDSRITVIHNPSPDPQVFRPRAANDRIAGELGIPAGAPLVTMVGKQTRRKGHDVFLRALPQVRQAVPKVRFLLVGGRVEGLAHRKYAEQIEAIPSELGVAEAVVWAGYRDDVAEIMAASDVIVHCSRFADPFPGAVLQGMLCAKPVVSVCTGGPLEQIDDGFDGFLVPPGEPEPLSSVLIGLLKDEQLRHRVGAAARQKVLDKFSETSFRQRLLDVYDEILTTEV